ncbi:hypothetical protein MMPV_008513 [Pyropia vietnamensis]
MDGPPSAGRPNRSSANHRPSVALDWGPASSGFGGGRRSADPNAGLCAVGEVGWSAATTTAPVASLDMATLAFSPPATAAMAWEGDNGPGGDNADEDERDFDIGMTRTVAAECLSPEMAAHLSTASDYLFAKKTRQVRFSSSRLALERPDLRLRPLGRCAWADVLLPLHNGLRVELSDIFDAVSSLQRRIATVRSAEFTILSTYITVFASYATASLTASYELLPPLRAGTTASASLPTLFTPADRSAASAALHETLGSLLGVLRTASRRPPDEVVRRLVTALPGLTAFLQHLDAMANGVGAAAAAAGLSADGLPAGRRRVGAALVGAGKFRRWHLLIVQRGARQLVAQAKAGAVAAVAAEAPGGGAGKASEQGRRKKGEGGGVSAGVWKKVMGGSYRRQYEVGHVSEIKRVIEVE